MPRVVHWIRLPLALLLAITLGYMLESLPGHSRVLMSDGASSVSVPKGLEGWKLAPGEGDMLMSGGTRLGLIHLEVEKTNLAMGGNLVGYISDRNSALWQAKEEYDVRLKGELKAFGPNQLPIAHAVYYEKFLGLWNTRYAQHDVYFQYKWQYVRVGLKYPEFLQEYFAPDMEYLALNIKFAP